MLELNWEGMNAILEFADWLINESDWEVTREEVVQERTTQTHWCFEGKQLFREFCDWRISRGSSGL